MLRERRPDASVIICTLDRAPYLAMALESLRHQTCPSDAFEIVVVDNGSVDGTRELLLSAMRTTPNLRWVVEDRRGLSHARNRGITEAQGDVLAFLDDDAIAAPEWLETIAHAMRSSRDVVAAGGPIRLRWCTERPAWVSDELTSLYSGLDLGDELREVAYPEVPYGANMAFRRSTFSTIGGFCTALGRRGESLLSGEEKELFHRIARSGGHVVYTPSASVEHQVLPERVSRRWLLRRSYHQGRSEIIVQALTVGRARWTHRMARAALHAGRAMAAATATAAAVVRRRPSSTVTRDACRAVHWLGSAVQGLHGTDDLVVEPVRILAASRKE